MSLVATFELAGSIPVAIGDLLISTPRQEDFAALPTFQDVSSVFPKDAVIRPCGLDQKILVLDGKAIIGWAGNRIAARDVITQLYHASLNDDLDYAFLSQTLQGIEEASFAGYVLDGGQIAGFQYHPQETGSHPLAQNITLLGSGALAARDILEAILPYIGREIDAFGELKVVDVASLMGLMLSGTLLQAELGSAGTLRDGFGGGYEIGYLDEDLLFRKVDGITYAFWQATVVNENEATLSKVPIHVCTYGYHEDILLVRSLSITASGAKHWISYVAPFYQHQIPKNLPPPPLNGKWLCNLILVTEGLASPELLFRIDRRSDEKAHLYFEERSDGLGVGGTNDLLEFFARQILNRYRSQRGIASIPPN